ncbi:MAG: hypothetical protein AAB368_13340, partial [bacterium]
HARPGRFVEVTQRMLRVLNRIRVRYCVIGGLAVAAYGSERSTRDVDLIIEIEPSSVGVLIRRLRTDGFRVTRLGAGDRRESGLRIQAGGTRVKGDIFWSGTLAEPELMARRRQVPIFKVPSWVCGPEDLILLKLKAGRWQDDEDIRGMLAVQARRLDRRRLLLEAGAMGRRRRLVALAREAGLRWR